MKTLHHFYSLLVCTLFMSLISCSEQKELTTAHSTVDIKLDEEYRIAILSGNGGYSVSVEDENILTASIENNAIILKPENKGKTAVILQDSEKFTKTMTITVIDPYIAYMVKEREFYVDAEDQHILHTIKIELEKSASLVADHIYEFNRSQLRTYSVFRQDWHTMAVAGGTYSFDQDKLGFSLKEGSKEFIYTLEENNIFAKYFYDYFVSPSSLSELPEYEEAAFTLEEDVTQMFQEGYPSAGIKEVKIIGKALLMEYKVQ